MNTEIYLQGFKKGLGLLKVKDTAKAKAKIMKALGINNRQSLLDYTLGKRKPSIEQVIAVNKAFAEFGVKEENVWGKEEN